MRRAATGRAHAPAVAHARAEAAVRALAEALATHGRGEPVRALEGLASVVMNRVRAARLRRAPAAWGTDLASALAAAGLLPETGAEPAPDELIAACRRIAARAAAGSLPDPTGGALFWHRAGTPPPPEAEGGEAVRFGGLVFLRPAGGMASAGDRGPPIAAGG
jgi:spore germination cell wall hydrolase CwlJ-like protein